MIVRPKIKEKVMQKEASMKRKDMGRKKRKNPNKQRERQDKGVIVIGSSPNWGEGDLQRMSARQATGHLQHDRITA